MTFNQVKMVRMVLMRRGKRKKVSVNMMDTRTTDTNVTASNKYLKIEIKVFC